MLRIQEKKQVKSIKLHHEQRRNNGFELVEFQTHLRSSAAFISKAFASIKQLGAIRVWWTMLSRGFTVFVINGDNISSRMGGREFEMMGKKKGRKWEEKKMPREQFRDKVDRVLPTDGV